MRKLLFTIVPALMLSAILPAESFARDRWDDNDRWEHNDRGGRHGWNGGHGKHWGHGHGRHNTRVVYVPPPPVYYPRPVYYGGHYCPRPMAYQPRSGYVIGFNTYFR